MSMTTKLTPEHFETAERLDKEATQGPWLPSIWGYQIVTGDSWNTVCTFTSSNGDHRLATWENGEGPSSLDSNARAIAFFRNHGPQAFRELKEARERIAELESNLKTLGPIVKLGAKVFNSEAGRK